MKQVFQYIFPGLMLMWIAFIAQNSLSDIFVEKEKKTLSRLLASPASLRQILFSKIMSCFLLCWIAEILLIIITGFIFQMSWGNPFWQFCVISSANLAMIGVLSCINGFSPTRNLADALTPIVILFSAFLGGSMVPYDEMPQFLKQLSSLSFIRWSILGMQNVIQSKPPQAVLFPCTILLGVGLLGIMLGTWSMKHRLERGGAA